MANPLDHSWCQSDRPGTVSFSVSSLSYKSTTFTDRHYASSHHNIRVLRTNREAEPASGPCDGGIYCASRRSRWAQTVFQVNLKLGLAPCPRQYSCLENESRSRTCQRAV